MAEEKKERLVDEVEGVTKEDVQLFKHGTHCDTIEELFSSIEENYKRASEFIDVDSPARNGRRRSRSMKRSFTNRLRRRATNRL